MFTVALLVSTLTALAAGRIYERCELARDLLALGVDRDQIATWVCIAYHESRFDTAAQNYGSGDHGLLQISELYWCGPGKACGAPCSAFRDNDISDDVSCALQIYREHTRLQGDGFLAWVVYPHHCKQNAKKYIVDCDKNVLYKNNPVKFDNRATYLKTSNRGNELKPRAVNNPYRSTVTPRYLSINSVFQGDFERNYYNSFKVENIDNLKLPGAANAIQRSRFLELSTRPTVVKIDPDLIGIKPPSPRKIESNQFRRRKTFLQPQFLKNKISFDEKNSETRTALKTVTTSESSLPFNNDLSENIFLRLQPSVLEKSVKEFFSPELKSSDFTRYQSTAPPVEDNTNVILSYNDLAQNPFLKSIFATNFRQNQPRGYTVPTSRPVTSFRSSKEIDFLSYPEVDLKLPEPGRMSSSLNNEDERQLSITELAQNPFLSGIFRVNNFKSSPVPRANYREEITQTTPKPTTKSVLKYLDNFTTRGSDRYVTGFDTSATINPVTESSTTAVTYSTRRYHTIHRQRSTTVQCDLKSTTAFTPIADTPYVTSTAKPFTNDINRKIFQIETTTSKTTTALGKDIQNNITEIKQKNKSRANITSVQGTTRIISSFKLVPATDNNVSVSNTSITVSKDANGTVNIPDATRKPLSTSSTGTVSTFHTTSRPQTTSREYTVTSRVKTVSRLNNTSKLQSINRTENTNRLHTTSRPQTTSRLQTTSHLDNISSAQPINKTESFSRLQTTTKPQTIRRPQSTNRIETTSRPSTTQRSWSQWRVRGDPILVTSTTARPNFTWNQVDNKSLNSTVGYFSSTEKPLVTVTEATSKTTLSIFDLYLRPSTKPPFRPFEFTSFNKLRKGISIFSGGTTRPPPTYVTSKKPTTE